MIGYEGFEKSLKHLELQYNNYKHLDATLPDLMKEAVKESVIRRFEVCYDTLWKHLKRYLIEETGLADVPNSPKPILKLAGQNKLFVSSVERWMKYADARTNTAHNYSESKAMETLSVVKDFIADAIGIYRVMTGAAWQ